MKCQFITTPLHIDPHPGQFSISNLLTSNLVFMYLLRIMFSLFSGLVNSLSETVKLNLLTAAVVPSLTDQEGILSVSRTSYPKPGHGS